MAIFLFLKKVFEVFFELFSNLPTQFVVSLKKLASSNYKLALSNICIQWRR